ncbi:MAG: hypothetical protein K0Q95_2442 [Bacteroidota bacterium]|jgi:pimeloyl-ACP methyl ester carboxylesterase|nr:hypothetical protein [Bacteroidota bacterium]
MSTLGFSQNRTTVYLFHGQGSDDRIFSKLHFGNDYKVVNIDFPLPDKHETIKSYALKLSSQIDTTSKFILIGMSLGGMICSELSDVLKPEHTIIISSAKCRKELPFRYRFQKDIPLNRIVPAGLIKAGALFLQPIVEPDRDKEEDTFKSMLKAKDPRYLKRTINMIVNWDKVNYSKDITHIHGNKDHTIPVENVKADHIIKDGSHMMTLTRAEELNAILQTILGSN